MTPAEHYAAAEQWLDAVTGKPGYVALPQGVDLVQLALVHAVLAVAGELGVPIGSTHMAGLSVPVTYAPGQAPPA